jgi:hypothetical protein
MKFKNDIEVQAGIKDSSGSDGTLGQVLSSTVSGVSWINPPVGVTGSGTTNFLPKWNSSTGLTDSIIFNNGNGVTIGATSSSPNSGWRLNIHPASTQAGLGIFCYNNNSLHGLRIEMTGTGDFIQARDVATQNDVFSVSYLGNTTANSFIKIGGTSSQYLMADGSVSTGPSVSGFVPYIGANQNVDLGIYTLLAAKGVFSSSGSANTVEIGHSSGSGIALNIIKGGNGEGLYINKTSGSGNAATIIGTLNATTLVKSGGTADQYLKADGSVSTAMNSRVEVNFTATAGQTTFTTTYDVGQIDVFYNGSKLNPSEFTATNGTTVVLAQAATLNAQISIVKYIGSINGVSGTANRVAKFTGITTLGDSQIDDNGTNVSIGYTTNPNTHKLDVNGTGRFSGTGLNASVRITNTTASTGKDWNLYSLNNGNFGLYNNTDGIYSLISTPSGNVGIGVTPSAWRSGDVVIDLGATTSLVNAQGLNTRIYTNAFVSSSVVNTYKTTNFATYYDQGSGQHRWFNAPSGTAGNTISFTQAMTLDASGRLGIGITSPTQRLHVANTSGTVVAYLQSTVTNGESNLVIEGRNSSGTIRNGSFKYDNSDILRIGTSSPIDFRFETSDTERLRIFSSGNVFIGPSASDNGARLQVSGAATFSSTVTSSDYFGILVGRNSKINGNGAYIYRSTDGGVNYPYNSNGNLVLEPRLDSVRDIVLMGSSATPIAVFQGGGNVLVGTTNLLGGGGDEGTNGLNIYQSGTVVNNSTSDFNAYFAKRAGFSFGGLVAFYVAGTQVGSISTNGSSTSYVTSSDYRLKEDIKPVENALERLQDIKPVNFAWKSSGDRVDGFIAHELAEVIPEAVTGEKDETKEDGTPVYQGIDQSKIVPLLVAAIQEQQELIKELTARLEILENK